MANQYNNKVVLSNGTTLIDLSTDTVTDASHIMSGKVGHLADGSVVTGTGASESQVVSIEDVPNTTGTTAVITGVAAPEGSISITTNGTHDVTAYEEAIVNVPSQTPTIQPLSVTSNGTYTAPSGVDGYSPVTVNVSGGGGGGSVDPDADVIFIDYDGTVLHSYSASEFANLTEMPENPSHAGLVAQGWNWSLADAKAQVAAMGSCTIGQMYITDDGTTRIRIELHEGRLSPLLGICPNGTVTIDWGDGSNTDSLTGTSLASVKTVMHEYDSAGEYIVTLSMESGQFSFSGTNTSSYLLRKSTSTSSNVNTVYSSAVKSIEMGENALFNNNYAFSNCRGLSTITMHAGITSIPNGVFYNCYGLLSATIPQGVTTVGDSAFYYCYGMTNVSMPTSITGISGTAFRNCSSLGGVSIPANVSTLGGSAFQSCSKITRMVIPHGVVSLSNTFGSCSNLHTVTVPDTVTSLSSTFSNSGVREVSLPSSVTTIADTAFYNCQSLSSITIPVNVTSIGTQAFYNCYGVAEYHFLPATPPTLANTNAFNNIQSECKIYVPKGSLEAYQTATNWSTYANRMVEEE